MQEILKAVSPAYGVCAFAPLQAHLLEVRAKARLPQGAQSVLVFLFPYLLEEASYEGRNVARYAVVPDYHDIVLSRLQGACDALQKQYPQHAFVPFTDNSPIPEVCAASLAGLGRRGENGLLIHPRFGSWVVIGEIVTTLALTQSAPVGDCLQCGACRRACPANALREDSFLCEKCLSRITQKKGTLTGEEAALLQKTGSAWGCDICQQVCPMNTGAVREALPEFREGQRAQLCEGDCLAGHAYAWRGEDVIARNLRLTQKEKKE